MSATITVVGLGSGDENQLSLGIWRKLQTAKRIVLRTKEHPVVRMLDEQQISYQTFDSLYEQYSSFPEVYEAITAELLRLASSGSGELLYAVPGHPMVAERTVRLLLQGCREQGIDCHILGGESFLDQAFLRLNFDPIEGFQLLDAAACTADTLRPETHTLITQVYDTFTASEVKLQLMEIYPDDYSVTVAHALGVVGEEQIRSIPLYELDRMQGYGNLSLIWVPRSEQEQLRNRSFARLREIVEILRSPEGCPWDREQTHPSLRRYLIEETYEVLETIDDDDPQAMAEELGDLLLQVMLHAQIEAETGAFNVRDVIQGLNEKLLRRHPHVFGNQAADNAQEALQNWQEIKAEEKKAKGIAVEDLSPLSGVPRDLPSLLKAWKLQKKAAAVGFDWERPSDVLDKVKEELGELMDAVNGGEASERRMDEMGDVLFAVINLARFLKIDPEEALASTNRKFVRRFSYIDQQLRLKGTSFDQTSLVEMEHLWQEAKKAKS